MSVFRSTGFDTKTPINGTQLIEKHSIFYSCNRVNTKPLIMSQIVKREDNNMSKIFRRCLYLINTKY